MVDMNTIKAQGVPKNSDKKIKSEPTAEELAESFVAPGWKILLAYNNGEADAIDQVKRLEKRLPKVAEEIEKKDKKLGVLFKKEIEKIVSERNQNNLVIFFIKNCLSKDNIKELNKISDADWKNLINIAKNENATDQDKFEAVDKLFEKTKLKGSSAVISSQIRSLLGGHKQQGDIKALEELKKTIRESAKK